MREFPCRRKMAVYFTFSSILLFVLTPSVYGKLSTISDIGDKSGNLAHIALSSANEASTTQPFAINVTIRGYVDIVRGKELLLDVKTDDVNIVPDYHDHSFRINDESTKKVVLVTFNMGSTSASILQQPVTVNISLSFQNKRSTSILAQLIDDRAEVGFLPEFQQHRPCYPNESCDVAIKNHKSSAMSAFNLTLQLLNKAHHNVSVSETNFTVMNSVSEYHIQVTAPNVGQFLATLSVSNDLKKFVVWNRRNLTVTIVENPMKAELDSLNEKFDKLMSSYKELLVNYTSLSTQLKQLMTQSTLDGTGGDCGEHKCGDYGECVAGHCDCTYPNTYAGKYCDQFIGCGDDPCGERGDCGSPDNMLDMYECTCKDEVTGVNCTECVHPDFCLNGGSCLVAEDGLLYCSCMPEFTGDYCESCLDGWLGQDCNLIACSKEGAAKQDCGDNGQCFYDENNTTMCLCDDESIAVKCHDSSSDEPTVSELPTPTPEQPSQPIAEPSDSSVDAEPSAPSVDADNNNLLYGGLIVFIAVLVVCLVLYLAYHNKDKIMELFGAKKESVVEMAMKSRSRKGKGYQKLPTSIHDTVTHED